MATLVARMSVLCTGAKEGTGPTLVLTTHKRGQYSTDEAAAEVLWFNCGECSCRVANERHLKLSCSSGLFFTRVCADRVSGTPSLLFHLSTAGVQSLAMHGPLHTVEDGMESPAARADGHRHKRARLEAHDASCHGTAGAGQAGQATTSTASQSVPHSPGLLSSYLSAVNMFVTRQYPAVSLEEHGLMPAVGSAGVGTHTHTAAGGASAEAAALEVGAPKLVHDSRSVGSYAGMPSVAGTRPGVRVWLLPVRLSLSPTCRSIEQNKESVSLACYAVHVHAQESGHKHGMGAWLAILDWPARHDTTSIDAYATLRQRVLRAIAALQGNTQETSAGTSAGMGTSGMEEVSVYHLNPPVPDTAAPLSSASRPASHATHFPAAARHAQHLHATCPTLFPLGHGADTPTDGGDGADAEHRASVGGVCVDWPAQGLARMYAPPGHALQLTGPPPPPPPPTLAVDMPALVPARSSPIEGRKGTSWQDLQQACAVIQPPFSTVPQQTNKDVAAALRRSMLGGAQREAAPASVSASSSILSEPADSSPALPFSPTTVSSGSSVTLLGTGAAAPSTLRSCSAIWLQLQQEDGSTSGGNGGGGGGMLLDCGEGALSRLTRSTGTAKESVPYAVSAHGLDVARLLGIWVSHMHADHHTGLMNVLAAYVRAHTLSMPCKPQPLSALPVVGPHALGRVLQSYCTLVRAQGEEEGWWPAGEDAGEYSGIVSFTPIRPSGPSRPVMGSFPSASPCSPLCVPLGLHLWQDVPVLHHGEAYGCVLGWYRGDVGYVLCYSGDTRPCAALVSACAGAVQHMQQGSEAAQAQGRSVKQVRVLLVHEATFAEDSASGALPEEEASSVPGSVDGGGGQGQGQGQGDGRGERQAGQQRRAGRDGKSSGRMTGKEHAIRKKHSTAEEAVGVAVQLKTALTQAQAQAQVQSPPHQAQAQAQVVLLPPVLTHFSARYAAEGDIRGRAREQNVQRDDEHTNGTAAAQAGCLVSVSGVRVLMASDGMRLPL